MGFRYPDDPASPLRWAQLLDRASADAAIPLEAVEDAAVEIVWDPPWNPSMMSEIGRAAAERH